MIIILCPFWFYIWNEWVVKWTPITQDFQAVFSSVLPWLRPLKLSMSLPICNNKCFSPQRIQLCYINSQKGDACFSWKSANLITQYTMHNGKHLCHKNKEMISLLIAEKINISYMKNCLKVKLPGTSLVVQWLRICLPMQGTWVWALVREDPTCHGATKPVRCNYWACTLEPTSHNYWARTPRARAPQQEKPPQWEACAPQRRVAPACCN